MKPPLPQHTTPCANCPFSRQCKPGALGGSIPSTYIGQARGPFWLPCHSTHDHTQDAERRNPDNPQCAGAAIFRANTGVIDQMPPQLLRLKPDTEKVFATSAEFLAHHALIDVDAALKLLESLSPEELAILEMKRSGVQPVNLPKEVP